MSASMQAALFDLDGTLVLTEARSRLLWAALFRRYGVEVDDDVLNEFMGRRGREVLRERPDLLPGRDPDAVTDETWRLESELDLPPVEPVPGAHALLRRVIAAGTPLAVVTSARRWYAEEKLAAIGVRGWFDTVVTGDDVTCGKPDPEGYVNGCVRLGVEPSRAAAFEDSPAGIAAAKGAGLACVGVTTSRTAAHLSDADIVVADLSGMAWPPAGLPAPADGQPGARGDE